MSESETRRCYSCGIPMQFAEKIPFRIRGTPGMWKLLVGEWAELGEEMLSLDVYVCPRCGLTSLYADEKAKQNLLKLTPKSFLKNCVECGREIPIAAEECQYCGAKQTAGAEL